MIYLHVMHRGALGVRSPMDRLRVVAREFRGITTGGPLAPSAWNLPAVNGLAWRDLPWCCVVARESWRVTTLSNRLAVNCATVLAPSSRRRASGMRVESLSIESTATMVGDRTTAWIPAVLAVE
jgi:hypothetical protein